MKQNSTSKEAIMQACMKIVSEQGIGALNMRAVAKECNIALGTLYNYYSDKNQLVLSAIENVWKDIFGDNHSHKGNMPFTAYVRQMFELIRKGFEKYPDFFIAHSIAAANSVSGNAKGVMKQKFDHMKAGITEALNADISIEKDVFGESFTREVFAAFVLDNLVLLLALGKESCDTLIEIISRIIYK